MKTIEQKLKEYIDEVYEDVYQDASPEEQEMQTKTDFKAGVTFAESWIDFYDELPEYLGDDFYILVKDLENKISLILVEIDCCLNDIRMSFSHWRPINRL
jgi:hypothetical protein